jgi:hypothetical protein
LGGNLIANGDFSNGPTNWNITVANTQPPLTITNGELCVSLIDNGAEVIGWGDATTSMNLAANVSYTLSYQASVSSALYSYTLHVGSAIPGFTIDAEFDNDAPGTALQTFTHTFSLTTADAHAGVAFQMQFITGAPVFCLDNVTLTQN